MPKFKMKLTGFEIEFEGDRNHAPEIASNVRRQIEAVVTPIAVAIDRNPVAATVETQLRPPRGIAPAAMS